jgi:Xaa-Pro aminopeptidase
VNYAERLSRFRASLAEKGLDAWYLVDEHNVRYLSGFTGADSTLLVTPEDLFLVTDSRYVEQAEADLGAGEVVRRQGTMAQAVGGLLGKLGTRRLGVASAKITHAALQALSAEAPQTEPVPCEDGIADQMRVQKDEEEIAAIGAALDLAERTFTDFLGQVRPAQSEKWMAARLEFEMRASGADKAAFDVISAVDANASKPHAAPTESRTTPECSILFDWGARLNGYCSDLTRVTCLGTIPAKLSELVEIVLAAQQAAFERLRPGCRCAEADAAARAVISRAGYEEFFGHGLGHGVGLEVHEAPRLAHDAQMELRPGMVVTVEPGIYLPGQVGVRIEEMVRITPQGCEVLSTLPRRPEELKAGGA